MSLKHHHKKIHDLLKKNHPKAVLKAKGFFQFKYKKLLILALMIAISYFIFSRPSVYEWINSLEHLGYFGTFIAGICNTFGFLSPIGMGLLFTISPSILILAALIGGIGAMMGDLFIFYGIKNSFKDEFKEMEKNKTISKIEKIVKNNKKVLIRYYVFYILAGIFMISPLPDDIGLSMLAGLTTIKPFKLALVSFFSHGTAIFLILYFASLV
jgi:hypothetical protein